MASSGDIESSSTELEQTDDIFNCQPCAGDDNNVHAVGYCVDCREYLCQRCFDGHLIPSITRKHVLLDNEKMKDTKKVELSMSPERCLQHKGKIVEYHCPTHDFFGCHVCSFKHQKDCKDVKYIPDIAEHILSSDEFKNFNTKLTGIATQCTDIVTTIKQTFGTVEQNSVEAIRAIKAFKKDVLEAVDELESIFIDTVNTFKQMETTKMSVMTDKVNKILVEQQKIASAMELLKTEHQHCDLYTTMVQTKEKLLSLELETQEQHYSMCRQETTLHMSKGNTGVLEMLKSQFGLEILQKASGIHSVERISDINVKCSNDTNVCRIIGSVPLNNNKIVFTDKDNNNVKLFDVSQNKIVSDLRLTSQPFGVCKVTDNQVAIAVTVQKKLLLVNTEPSLSIERELGVNGNCYGVGYCDGKFVVSYSAPDKIEMLDLQGRVLKVIEKDHQGQSLFNSPYHLCIDHDNKLIYVSNLHGSNLMCLQFDGTVVAKYTDSKLLHPWQVTCDSSGMVYVCGRASHNIHQVTEDCRKVKVLLTSADGLAYPESVCHYTNAGRLYIGQDNDDSIKQYRVMYKSV